MKLRQADIQQSNEGVISFLIPTSQVPEEWKTKQWTGLFVVGSSTAITELAMSLEVFIHQVVSEHLSVALYPQCCIPGLETDDGRRQWLLDQSTTIFRQGGMRLAKHLHSRCNAAVETSAMPMSAIFWAALGHHINNLGPIAQHFFLDSIALVARLLLASPESHRVNELTIDMLLERMQQLAKKPRLGGLDNKREVHLVNLLLRMLSLAEGVVHVDTLGNPDWSLSVLDNLHVLGHFLSNQSLDAPLFANVDPTVSFSSLAKLLEEVQSLDGHDKRLLGVIQSGELLMPSEEIAIPMAVKLCIPPGALLAISHSARRAEALGLFPQRKRHLWSFLIWCSDTCLYRKPVLGVWAASKEGKLELDDLRRRLCMGQPATMLLGTCFATLGYSQMCDPNMMDVVVTATTRHGESLVEELNAFITGEMKAPECLFRRIFPSLIAVMDEFLNVTEQEFFLPCTAAAQSDAERASLLRTYLLESVGVTPDSDRDEKLEQYFRRRLTNICGHSGAFIHVCEKGT
ncbi:hypothetical protein CCUS01_06556 [Colletotrichum cuscutae]|uniref:Uncharacterized protein n=1 Tax=Colletotrichum cuscutae TaxID=1209917 RepID=A0AAI9V6A3_9PEZI|nr:hypothetical protein CCUS01_06556 [Colletotrichum cuscutae]